MSDISAHLILLSVYLTKNKAVKMKNKIKQVHVALYAILTSICLSSCEEVPHSPIDVAVSQSGSTIIVSWSLVDDATGYNVYRSTNNADFSSIGTSSGASFIDESPFAGRNYYVVAAINNVGESNTSSPVSCEFLPHPENVRATQSFASITITWNSVSQAKSYIVYRNNSATGAYTSIGETITVSGSTQNFSDDNPFTGLNFYRIASVNDELEGGQSGYVSCEFTPVSPDVPRNLNATTDGLSVAVTWNSVAGAASYNIYHSNAATGTYDLIGEEAHLSGSIQSYTDDNPRIGANFYRITAINDVGEGDRSSAASCDFIPLPVPPTDVSASQSGTSITVSWDKVEGATNYRVYRSNSETGTYTSLGTSNNTTSYSDSRPLAGINYYRVTTINSRGESAQSDAVSCEIATRPATPTNVSASTSSNWTSIVVSWNAVARATGYRVWRNSTATGTPTMIGQTSETSYTDESPLSGNNFYSVSAINSVGESDRSSAVSPNFTPFTTTTTNEGTFLRGADLTFKLDWLQKNAESHKIYIVEVNAAEDIAPNKTIVGANIINITVIIRGIGENRTIRLLSHGRMFTVNSSVTLTLDNNITLQGHSDNTDALIYVNGGTFRMNTGATITGNIRTAGNSNGGGVFVNSGTFTMNNGTISGNTASNGGGVYVNGGAFNMIGGTITNNTATAYGGGVCVNLEAGSVFSKTGGTITGGSQSNENRVRDNSGALLSNRGHAVYVSGTMRREITAGTNVNLSTTNQIGWVPVP